MGEIGKQYNTTMARLTHPSDQSLAISLQSGNMQALTQIISRYQTPLLRYANYLGVGEQDEDIVQETFIKVYKNINSYDVRRSFSTWIYRITHNTAISAIRGQHYTLPWDDYLDRFIKQDPVDDFDSNIQKEQVKKCLSQLPLSYRAPLSLYYLEDKSYSEIMDILRLPMGTVSARINRAKKQMRNLCQKI